MRAATKIALGAAVLLAGAGAAAAYLGRGALPIVLPVKEIPAGATDSQLGLTIPAGFGISVYAEGLGAVRDIEGAVDLLASVPSDGVVLALQDVDMDGRADIRKTVLEGLNKPHGILRRCLTDVCTLFVATEDAVTAYDFEIHHREDAATNPRVLAVLPTGGRHSSRSLAIIDEPADAVAVLEGAPDTARLLVAIGSACDTCVEADPKRGSVQVLAVDGKGGLRPYATGLRNSVFLVARPGTEELWATDMGRDFLGDDLPPEEVNVLTEGAAYGWPYCYGDKVRDRTFKGDTAYDCGETAPPRVQLPAHGAPLGLAFVPGGPDSRWPADWHGDLLVALHGSWNKSVPDGYKVVRVDIDAQGRQGAVTDLVSGWLQGPRSTGRPVDLEITDGELYISDDKGGRIYRLAPEAT